MKLLKTIFLFSFIFLGMGAYSLDMKDVVAYPVPYDPHKGVLTIGYPAGYSGSTAFNIKVVVYDINGDIVVERDRAQLPLKWNGRNKSGRRVKRGMYLLKVTVENDDGEYGRKIIRILVDY